MFGLKLFDLKIGLGLGFDKFNRDLKKAADQIEELGKSHSVKVGAVAEDVAAGKLDPGQLNNMVAGAGMRLSAGLAEGIRRSSALMLGFVARVNVMLDKLVGSAVTIFRRIDTAMKFPAFDRFFKTAQLKLSNFSALWRKPLSDVDIAIQGGFGGTFQRVTKIVKSLVDELAATIARALKEAVTSVAMEFAKVATNASRAEAAAQGLFGATRQAAQAATRFPRFAPQSFGQGIPPRGATVGSGRRLGFGANFNTPAPPVGPPPQSPWIAAAKTFGQDLAVGAKAAIDTLATLGSVAGKVGAALVSVPLRAYIPFARLSRFFSMLGDVGKQSFGKIYEQNGILVGSILTATKVVTGLSTAALRVGTLGVFGKASKDAQSLDKSVKATTTSVGQLSGGVKHLGRELLAAFGIVGVAYKVVRFFTDGIKGASDLNETVSQSRVIFGQSFGAIDAQANRLTQAFGVSRKAQLDAAAGFGAMARGAGFGEEAAASLSKQLMQAAAQFSASENIPFEEAADKIRSGLSGSAKALREHGAWLDEDSVKTYALTHGMAANADAVTNQAKVAARAAIILEDLAYTQGALERSTLGAAGQFRKAGGGMEEFGLRIGQLLLPTIQAGTEAFNEFLAATLGFVEAAAPTLQSWAENVANVFRGVGLVIRNWGAVWEIAKLSATEFVMNFGAVMQTVPENFGRITAWLGRNWLNLLVDLGNMAATAFGNLVTNAANLGTALWNAITGQPWEFAFTPLLDGFKATTEQFPELVKPALVDMGEEMRAKWAEIFAKEQARTDAMKQAAVAAAPTKTFGPPADAKADMGKTSEYRLANAVEFGSKEAYSVVAKSQVANRNVPNQQLAEAKSQTGVLRSIDQKISKGGMQLAVR